MRQIDAMESPNVKGNSVMVKKFEEYLKVKYSGGGKTSIDQPSTVNLYKKIFEEDILGAIHRLHEPSFNAEWLIDCRTPKECFFEGEARSISDSTEPVYLTSKIFQEASAKYDRGETGKQRAQLVSTFTNLMDFIESHFNDKINLYGRNPLVNVQTHHNGTRTYLNSINVWSKCNQEKAESLKKNKRLKDYKDPNNEAKTLKAWKEYLESPRNGEYMRKLLSYAPPDSGVPSDADWTEIGLLLMGLLIAVSGIVLLNFFFKSVKRLKFSNRCQ